MPKQPIAIPYKLRETLQRGLAHYKIIFLSAGTGWGKTATVNKLLEKQNPTHLSLRKKSLPNYFSKERLIVLDDFHELPSQAEEQFQEILRKSLCPYLPRASAGIPLPLRGYRCAAPAWER